ncbi:hypothetical protein D3C78_1673780 [compost metagenome]
MQPGKFGTNVGYVWQHASCFLLQFLAYYRLQFLACACHGLFAARSLGRWRLAPTEKFSTVDAFRYRHRLTAAELGNGGTQGLLMRHGRPRVNRRTWCGINVEVLGRALS